MKFLIFLISLFSLVYLIKSDELFYVQVITRHGARTPFNPLPDDLGTVWNCSFASLDYFSEGNTDNIELNRIFRKKYIRNRQTLLGNCSAGQLTAIGSEQHRSIGRSFRERYVNQLGFLERNYNKEQIYLRTTDYERTLNSAESLIDGLYPAAYRNTSDLGVIDIDTIEVNTDNLYPQDNCPKLTNLCYNVEQTQKWKNILNSYEYLYKQLQKVWNITNVPPYFELFSTFESRAAQNMSLPPGFTQKMVDDIVSVCSLQLGVLYGENNISKLGIGRFYTDFTEAINARVTNTSSYKFSLYSAHDVTLGLILNSLDLYSQAPYWPPFAGHLVFEYSKDTNSNIYVDIYYQGNKMNIPGCRLVNSHCYLQDFLNIIKPFALTNQQWNHECNDDVKFTYVLKDDLTAFLC